MPRIRYLKPDFFTDEHISELGYAERLAFQGLWCYADREGRLEDKPKFLKVAILPYDNEDMDKILSRLSTGGKPLIHRYSLDGKSYIQIINFIKHQKPHHTEKDSIIPVFRKEQEKENGKEKIKGSDHEASERLRNGEKTVKRPLNKDYPNEFITFWQSYPRKTGKGSALKAWVQKTPPLDKCLSVLKWQTALWSKGEARFIPHPATWLNAGRWDDEPCSIGSKTGDCSAPIPGKYDGMGEKA